MSLEQVVLSVLFFISEVTKWTQQRGKCQIKLHVQFILSQCALFYNTCHRSTNAFALAQVVPQNRLPFDMLVSAPLSLFSLFSVRRREGQSREEKSI